MQATQGKTPNIRIRPDLVIRQQQTGAAPRWIVKDPITLKYYYFGAKEIFILELLDGQHSFEKIIELYEQRFAPHKLKAQEVAAFSFSLHSKGLAIAQAEMQADVLLKRDQEQRLLKVATSPLNLLAIRLPGIDPERFLTASIGWVAWLFHPATVMITLVCSLAIMTMGLFNLESILTRMPSTQQLFLGENLFWMMIALSMIKILHELGHAYACKYFKGECHEIGILLLAFVPCMYCNVSDAWLLPQRRQRIFISAAGMYVELILATAACCLWYFSHPGLLNSFCLNVMFVCGISTLMINANPLLRYDGYYIFADWVNVPNLSQQSSEALWHPVKNWFLQSNIQTPRLDANVWFLRTYAICSLAYRIFVISMILWFVYDLFDQYDMRTLADIVLVSTIAGLLLQPTIQFCRWWRVPMNHRNVNSRRMGIAALLLVGVLTGTSMIPYSTRVTAHALSELANEQRIAIPVEGRILTSVSPGQKVSQGDTIAVLENHSLQFELVELEGKLEIARQELKNLELLSINNPEAQANIPTAKSAFAELNKQHDLLLRDLERLRIVAKETGTIFPPPIISHPNMDETQLSTWQGTPLDEQNRGCFLERSTHLCSIGTRDQLQTRLIFEQGKVELIQLGDRVEILVDGLAHKTITGSIIEISEDQIAEAPRNLALGADMQVKQNRQGQTVPVEPSYQAVVKLDETPDQLLPGSRGRAVIIGKTQTIGERVMRFLNLNFRFAS